MKDYTKYNFAAIIGAEVTIVTHEGYEHVGQLVSTQLSPSDVEQLIIYLPEEDGCILINADYVNNLTAKIKVEDMSVKQLKKAFNLGTYEVLVFNEATGTIANRDVDGGELGHTYEELPFSDYINCTDWGWNHE